MNALDRLAIIMGSSSQHLRMYCIKNQSFRTLVVQDILLKHEYMSSR